MIIEYLLLFVDFLIMVKKHWTLEKEPDSMVKEKACRRR